MAIIDIKQLKSWFSKGIYPKAAHFAAWFDSFWHKNDKIPISAVDGLPDKLNGKYDASEMKVYDQTLADISQNLKEHHNASAEDFRHIHKSIEDLENSGGVETIQVNSIAERDALKVPDGTFCVVTTMKEVTSATSAILGVSHNNNFFNRLIFDTINTPNNAMGVNFNVEAGFGGTMAHVSSKLISTYEPSIPGIFICVSMLDKDIVVWSAAAFVLQQNDGSLTNVVAGWNKTTIDFSTHCFLYAETPAVWTNASMKAQSIVTVLYQRANNEWLLISPPRKDYSNWVKDFDHTFEQGSYIFDHLSLNGPPSIRVGNSGEVHQGWMQVVHFAGDASLMDLIRTVQIVITKGSTGVFIRNYTAGCCCDVSPSYKTWTPWNKIYTDFDLINNGFDGNMKINGSVSATAFNTETTQRSGRSVGAGAAGFEAAPKVTPHTISANILDMTACRVESIDGCVCVEFELQQLKQHFPDCVYEVCECEDSAEITHGEGCKNVSRTVVEPREKKILIDNQKLNTQMFMALINEIKTLKDKIETLKN